MTWQQYSPCYSNSNTPWIHTPNPKHPDFGLIEKVLNARRLYHLVSKEENLKKYKKALEDLKADSFTYNFYLEKGFDK